MGGFAFREVCWVGRTENTAKIDGKYGESIRKKNFLVGHFPKILLPFVFRCGRFGSALMSVGRCISAIGFDRPRRDTSHSLVHYGGCAWGTFACAGSGIRRSVNLCTAATHVFDSKWGAAQEMDTKAC